MNKLRLHQKVTYPAHRYVKFEHGEDQKTLEEVTDLTSRQNTPMLGCGGCRKQFRLDGIDQLKGFQQQLSTDKYAEQSGGKAFA